MAERVNQRIEDTITELEQMQRLDLYTSDEIREIARKRKDFEYKIERQQKCKEDYVRYIAYESALLKDISLRRRQIKNREKQQEIEFAITKRLNKLYKQLIFRFQSDLSVWLEYIKFCKSVDFSSSVSQIMGSLLQVHGDKPKVWHLASMWECQETKNVDLALKFLLKGLLRHPKSKLLYKEALLLEVIQADQELAENKDLRLKRCEVVCRTAMSKIPDIDFHIEICKVLQPYRVAFPLIQTIVSKLWTDHKDEVEMWHFIAQCELDGIHFDEINECLSSEDTSNENIPDNIRNCTSIYEHALLKFEDEDILSMYLSTLLNLTILQCSTDLKIDLLKRALQQGHNNVHLTEAWYKFWIQLLIEDSQSSENIDQILKEACSKVPYCEYLWKIRIQRSKDDPSRMEDVLFDAKKHLTSEKTLFLWNLILDTVKDLASLKILYEESHLLPTKVSVPLRLKFLVKFNDIEGVKRARKEYLKMVNIPPLDLSLHQMMLDIEAEQKTINLKSCKRCHEYATQQFGKDNPQVWLDYMRFEMQCGNPSAIGQLHSRAVAQLKHENVDEFIRLYSLQKAGIETSINI